MTQKTAPLPHPKPTLAAHYLDLWEANIALLARGATPPKEPDT